MDATRKKKAMRSVQEFKRVEVKVDLDGGAIMTEFLAEKGICRWKNTLVGVLLGCRIPLGIIDRNIRRMWKKWRVLDMTSVGI